VVCGYVRNANRDENLRVGHRDENQSAHRTGRDLSGEHLDVGAGQGDVVVEHLVVGAGQDDVVVELLGVVARQDDVVV
jgi:hypothetical protein